MSLVFGADALGKDYTPLIYRICWEVFLGSDGFLLGLGYCMVCFGDCFVG
jgi:hypothetical protein